MLHSLVVTRYFRHNSEKVESHDEHNGSTKLV
uniref:Uncharacterized protein n=1 Tax=Arundo donax TaxID=35708 RepID=A0A0A8ZAQ4_ARUDO